MESLDVITRFGKNFYIWNGFHKILDKIENVIFFINLSHFSILLINEF